MVSQMTAFEFKTAINDGIINVPTEYRSRPNQKVKVILLMEDEPIPFNSESTNAKSKSDLLLPPAMNTKEWKWNREEANER